MWAWLDGDLASVAKNVEAGGEKNVALQPFQLFDHSNRVSTFCHPDCGAVSGGLYNDPSNPIVLRA